MELGLAKILRSRINCLTGSQVIINKKYGLAWTDGTNVYLSEYLDKNFEDISSQIQTTFTVGKFSDTIGVYWSPENWNFLAVHCLESLSIFRIKGRFPEIKVENLQQDAQKTLTPQNCGWHPSSPLLFTASKTSVVVFNWDNSRSSFLQRMIDFKHTILATRWSNMGELYILTQDFYLQVFSFDDSQPIKYEIRSCALPHSKGIIRCLCPLSHDLIVMAADLPLTDLIALSHQDVFETACLENEKTVGRMVAEKPDLQTGPIDLTAVIAKGKSKSKDKSPKVLPLENVVDLTTLKYDAKAASSHLFLTPTKMSYIKDSSQLMVIDISSGEAKIVCTASLPNILQPDLLTCTKNQIIAVGSNTQSNLQLFQFKESSLKNLYPICLGENERPKGLCCFNNGFLVMVGIKLEDKFSSVFLPSSLFERFKMKLQKFPAQHNSPVTGIDAETPEKELTYLRLPGGSIFGSATLKQKRENMEKIDTNCNCYHSTKEGGTKFYPSAESAGIIHLYYENEEQTTWKTFLLNQDLLHLQTVKDAFSLSLVELFIGSHPVILSPDKDGYIPISFTNGQTIRINGKK